MKTNNTFVDEKVDLEETKKDEHLGIVSRTLEMSQDNILINEVK